MDKKIALENLKDIRDVLNELGIRYFLIDGTLLGLIRDNDFIRFDLDTDIGVRFEDFDLDKLLVLRNSLSVRGFENEHIFGDFQNNYELSFTRFGVKTDLFFYRPQGDKMVFHAFDGDNVITYWYEKRLIDELVEAKFNGVIFSVPKFAEEILVAKYGADWKIEDRNWDWAYSPFNVLKQRPIVFTVGCFDTLHEGHINLFNKMAEEAKLDSYDNPRFWVFIHDDYSILKNKGRLPIQDLKHRSTNLDILKITHSIEVNNPDPTPEIKSFVEKNKGRSMVYMRGDDWVDFPGKKYLVEAGIPIKYVLYTEGVSTTLIRKSLNN